MEDAIKQIASKYWTNWTMLQEGFLKDMIDEDGNTHDLREDLESFLKENFVAYNFVVVDLGYQKTKELYIISYVDDMDLMVHTIVLKLINREY